MQSLQSKPTIGRVLVVDDETPITELVTMALRYEGYQMEQANSGREAIEKVTQFHPDILILDIMMPDLDGYEVARKLRQENQQVPIIFLTAKDSTEDKVRGLGIGGDDYVTKPFSLEELSARVAAVLRRTRGDKSVSSRLVFEDLELDEETREVYRDGNVIELTATEFRLLRFLMLNARRVVSKAQILDHVWEYDFGGDANIVETYISYLRKKIGTSDDAPLIKTIRGVGYSLRSQTGPKVG
ncbi:MAG: response regulator transcription factor [Actinomycetota bacterium]|nr:MAG: response regulator transcription factor [Actinomycetota bacterium]